MKIQDLILILLIITGVIIQGCDSATDSKAVSITPPVLVSPADGDTLTITIPTFTWTNEADKFEIDDNGGFTSPNSYVISGTQFSLPDPLQTNKWYYWRAGITAGNTTYWSQDIFHFLLRSN